MHRVDTATAVAVLPAPEVAGTPGYFTKGDAVGGVAATVPGQDWFNMMQEEKIAILDAVGVTPDQTKADYGQIIDALLANFANIIGNASNVFRVAPAVGANDATPLAQVQSITTTNIVSATKTDTWQASVPMAGVSADVPGLTVTITPTAIGKKILLSGAVVLGLELDANIYIILYRNGVAIGIGDAAGNRRRVTAGASVGPSSINTVTLPFTVLDAPATTDPVVYTIRLAHASSATRVISLNRDDVYIDNANNHATMISSITAMELNNA